MMNYWCFMVIDMGFEMSKFMVDNVRFNVWLGYEMVLFVLMMLWDRCENEWLIHDLIRNMMDIML